MVVSYGDNLFDIVECKYHKDTYIITKEYGEKLRNKLEMFRKYGLGERQKAELRLVMLTSYGVQMNAEANRLYLNSVTLEDLFE